MAWLVYVIDLCIAGLSPSCKSFHLKNAVKATAPGKWMPFLVLNWSGDRYFVEGLPRTAALHKKNKDVVVEVFDFDALSHGLCPQAFRESEWRSARFAD